MVDVTALEIEEMEPIFDGLVRRARASLGVTSFGMQVITLPPNWAHYPEHRHDDTVPDANQEEVYIPLEGSGRLLADGEEFELRPGMMVRVGPMQLRRIIPGPTGSASSRSAAFPVRSTRRSGRSSARQSRREPTDGLGEGVERTVIQEWPGSLG